MSESTPVTPDLKRWRPSLYQRCLGGHLNFGPVTIFGDNAMHWGVTIRTRWGYVCFRLPFRSCSRWWPLYLYCSPDATPNAKTWGYYKW